MGLTAELGPGAASLATGAIQGTGEFVTQLMNFIRREQLAPEVERVSEQAAEWTTMHAGESADSQRDRIASLADRGRSTIGDMSTTLRTGRDEAIRALDGTALIKDAESRGASTMQRRDEDITRLRDLLGGAVSGARRDVGEVQTEGTEALDRIRTEGDSYIQELLGRSDDVVAGIRTNMTERAGSTVGGIRSDAKRRAEEFEVKARQEGQLTSAEIDQEKNRIIEGATTAVSKVWGDTFTALSDQVASAKIAGNQMYTTMASTLSNTLAGLETTVINAVTATRMKASDIALGAAQTEEMASQARAELDLGVNNYVTGTKEFVSKETSELISQESKMQAAIGELRLNYETDITNRLNLVDQQQMVYEQQAIDTWLNGQVQSLGARMSFQFMFPNMMGLSSPGFSMMQNSMIAAAQPGPKSGFSASIFGTGGGTSCVSCHSLITTDIGSKTLRDIKLGDKVLGGDGKYHVVKGKDEGVVPLKYRHDMIMLTVSLPKSPIPNKPTVATIWVTEDHFVNGTKASELGIGDKIHSLLGEGAICCIQKRPYRISGDLELDGCDTYFANGLMVESMISKMSDKDKAELLRFHQEKSRT
jgi:hypothetical protein